MKNEIKIAYERIKEKRLNRSKKVGWTDWKDFCEMDVEYLGEMLIEASEFGIKPSMIRAQFNDLGSTHYMYTEGIERDISEINIIPYAKRFFKENLSKFGNAEIYLEKTGYNRGIPKFNWVALFEPKK